MPNNQDKASLRRDILDGLEKAEQQKDSKNFNEAVENLTQLKKLVYVLNEDEKKGSIANPTNDDATSEVLYYEKRGHILYDLAEYEEAEKCVRTLAVMLPNDLRVDKELGDCLRKQGRYDEALPIYDNALKKWEKSRYKIPSLKANILSSKGLNYIAQEKYADATTAFEGAIKLCPRNPLFECNKGKALFYEGKRDEALKCFTTAEVHAEDLLKALEEATEKGENERIQFEADLASDTGLKKENFVYIRETLKPFIKVLESMNQDKIKDRHTLRRENSFVSNNLERIGRGEDINIQADSEKIKDVKNMIREIEKMPNRNCYMYYDGFMSTISEAFTTSVVVKSGKVATDTGDMKVDIASKLISFIPLIGDKLSTIVDASWGFYKDASIKKEATYITQFAAAQCTFEEIAQDAICTVILEHKKEIDVLPVDNYILPTWEQPFKKLKMLAKKINATIYGERNTESLQKAGYKTASIIIAETLASGKFSEGYKAPVYINQEEKVKILMKAIRETLKKDLENQNLEYIAQEDSSDAETPSQTDVGNSEKNKSPSKTSKVTPVSSESGNSNKSSKKKKCLFF